jgi:phage portal protein BeeE
VVSQAAAQAAGACAAADQFVTQFFARGAIKATLLTVDGNPSPDEMKKLETWWKRFFSGIGSAWSTAAVRAGVTPVTVGEGLESLNTSTLTDDKQKEILVALGVPASLVMANAANYATAQQDEQNFYNLTIIPDARLIQRQINRQLLAPMGLRMTFKPQELACFQEDENTRSAAFKNYTDAGIRLSVAAEILGLYLPNGMEYADLDPDEPERWDRFFARLRGWLGVGDEGGGG